MSAVSAGTGKRARSEEGSSPSTRRSKGQPVLKRRRSDRPADEQVDGRQHDNSKRRACTGLSHLPVELLFAVHLYAKNPSLTVVNKQIHSIFRSCPTSIKARYLLARWHEAYCYGYSATAAQRRSTQTAVPNRPPLPSLPLPDLLDNGALAELAWTSRFIPVLPANEFPYPLSNSSARSADHFILDYCLRYPMTDEHVLHATEELVMRSPEFGNIVAATGLWRDTDGLLHPHEPRKVGQDESNPESSDVKPAHLRVTELPRRLFQSLKTNEGTKTSQDVVTAHADDIDPNLARYLRAFGNGCGPFPSCSSLMLLLSVAAQHVPTTTALPSASAPFNSFEGLPLAKATFAKSPFMVQLLLALGAEPSKKGSLSLYIAIRNGWLEGLRQLVERDESKLIEWQAALEGIRAWFAQRETQHRRFGPSPPSEDVSSSDTETRSMTDSPHKLPVPVSMSRQNTASLLTDSSISTPTSIGTFKRRRLLDRAALDSKMLKEAVKRNCWPVANWLRSKGIAPDLRTIKLIEMKQSNNADADV